MSHCVEGAFRRGGAVSSDAVRLQHCVVECLVGFRDSC